MTTSAPAPKTPSPWVDGKRSDDGDTKELELGFSTFSLLSGNESRPPTLSVSSLSTVGDEGPRDFVRGGTDGGVTKNVGDVPSSPISPHPRSSSRHQISQGQEQTQRPHPSTYPSPIGKGGGKRPSGSVAMSPLINDGELFGGSRNKTISFLGSDIPPSAPALDPGGNRSSTSGDETIDNGREKTATNSIGDSPSGPSFGVSSRSEKNGLEEYAGTTSAGGPSGGNSLFYTSSFDQQKTRKDDLRGRERKQDTSRTSRSSPGSVVSPSIGGDHVLAGGGVLSRSWSTSRSLLEVSETDAESEDEIEQEAHNSVFSKEVGNQGSQGRPPLSLPSSSSKPNILDMKPSSDTSVSLSSAGFRGSDSSSRRSQQSEEAGRSNGDGISDNTWQDRNIRGLDFHNDGPGHFQGMSRPNMHHANSDISDVRHASHPPDSNDFRGAGHIPPPNRQIQPRRAVSIGAPGSYDDRMQRQNLEQHHQYGQSLGHDDGFDHGSSRFNGNGEDQGTYSIQGRHDMGMDGNKGLSQITSLQPYHHGIDSQNSGSYGRPIHQQQSRQVDRPHPPFQPGNSNYPENSDNPHGVRGLSNFNMNEQHPPRMIGMSQEHGYLDGQPLQQRHSHNMQRYQGGNHGHGPVENMYDPQHGPLMNRHGNATSRIIDNGPQGPNLGYVPASVQMNQPHREANDFLNQNTFDSRGQRYFEGGIPGRGNSYGHVGGGSGGGGGFPFDASTRDGHPLQHPHMSRSGPLGPHGPNFIDSSDGMQGHPPHHMPSGMNRGELSRPHVHDESDGRETRSAPVMASAEEMRMIGVNMDGAGMGVSGVPGGSRVGLPSPSPHRGIGRSQYDNYQLQDQLVGGPLSPISDYPGSRPGMLGPNSSHGQRSSMDHDHRSGEYVDSRMGHGNNSSGYGSAIHHDRFGVQGAMGEGNGTGSSLHPLSSLSQGTSSPLDHMVSPGVLPSYAGAGDPAHRATAGMAGGASSGGSSSPRVVYNVKFKRTQRSFILGPRVPRDVKIGYYVKVEADRGEDLGIVVGRMPADKFHSAGRSNFRLSAGPVSGLGLTPSGDLGSGAAGSVGMSPITGGVADLKRIVRLATHDEVSLLVVKREEEEELLKICRAKVRQRNLPMNVVDAEYQFDRHKLTFFFEAEGRIDFRELVRDLFSIYKTRIWMQQLDKNNVSAGGTGSTASSSILGSVSGDEETDDNCGDTSVDNEGEGSTSSINGRMKAPERE